MKTFYLNSISTHSPLFNVMYSVRVSLWTVKNIPCAALKRRRRGSWVISVYLWLRHGHWQSESDSLTTWKDLSYHYASSISSTIQLDLNLKIEK